MSKVDSNTAEAAEKMSFLAMIQNAINGVTDEDIAEHWPTDPVAEGETVLGAASRELQSLNTVRFRMVDFVNSLIGELRSMAEDEDVTMGQLKRQQQVIQTAGADHSKWDELFWQMLRLEFGLGHTGFGLRADGQVVRLPSNEPSFSQFVDAALNEFFGRNNVGESGE